MPVVVDFPADWCGPCRAMAPVLDGLAADGAGRLLVLKVNTDENPGLSERFGIRGIPTVIAFRAGKEMRRLIPVIPIVPFIIPPAQRGFPCSSRRAILNPPLVIVAIQWGGISPFMARPSTMRWSPMTKPSGFCEAAAALGHHLVALGMVHSADVAFHSRHVGFHASRITFHSRHVVRLGAGVELHSGHAGLHPRHHGHVVAT